MKKNGLIILLIVVLGCFFVIGLIYIPKVLSSVNTFLLFVLITITFIGLLYKCINGE